MFGYLRPLRGELKCKDFDLYKATYCGLCCTLRERYGMIAPFFLSYDLTFLALLLEEKEFSPCKGRCHGNVFVKKTRSPSSEALERCADITIILAWYQCKDDLADEGIGRKIIAWFLLLSLGGKYKKAKKRLEDFDNNTKDSLMKLGALEKASCASMDQAADCFASILRDVLPPHLPNHKQRCLTQLLYHVGRWIYLVDARDDFSADLKKGRYNPLFFRYGSEIPMEDFEATLHHSLFLAQSAFDLLDFGIRHGVIDNMLNQGMPAVQYLVLHDCWQKEKNETRWRAKE
ncbi:MAG: DUF5685 family protein [Eubacteriales bacterium]